MSVPGGALADIQDTLKVLRERYPERRPDHEKVWQAEGPDGLAMANFRLILPQMIKWRYLDVPAEDLFQECFMALLRAARTWNHVVPFQSYAAICIHNILLLIWRREKRRKRLEPLRLPGHGLAHAGAYTVRSVRPTGRPMLLMMEEDRYAHVDRRLDIERALRRSGLLEREREVLLGRCGPEQSTLGEVAKTVGVSKERVRQIQTEAEEKVASAHGGNGNGRDL